MLRGGFSSYTAIPALAMYTMRSRGRSRYAVVTIRTTEVFPGDHSEGWAVMTILMSHQAVSCHTYKGKQL